MTLNGGQELALGDRDSRARETGGARFDGTGRRRGIDPAMARHSVDCGNRCRRRDALDGQTARPTYLHFCTVGSRTFLVQLGRTPLLIVVEGQGRLRQAGG